MWHGCAGRPSLGFPPRIGVRGMLLTAGITMALRRPHKRMKRPANCVVGSRQGERCLSIQLRIINCLRLQATRAIFFGFPAFNRRW